MMKPLTPPLYLALLHYPISNRNGKVVTTAVTNLDIHDISRSARTYGVLGYYLVTPIEDQKELVGRILTHWRTEASQRYHPDRFEALSLVRLVDSFEILKKEVTERHDRVPEVFLTDARPHPQSVSYRELRREWEQDAEKLRPRILVFGTGWGVAPEFLSEVDRILEPVYGPEREGGYNHLSVRSAAAIILDRLLGF